MHHIKRRFTLLVMSLLSITLMASPALAQGKGKGKDKTPPGKMKAEKGKPEGKGKPAGKGKPEKAEKEDKDDKDGKARGKENAPGQIKKATGEHPGGKGKADAPGQIKKATGEHPGGKAKGKKDKAKVKAFKKDDDLSKEEVKHLERLTKIDRIEEIAKKNGNEKLVTKAIALRAQENLRHEKKVSKLDLKDAGKANKPEDKGKPEGVGKPDDKGKPEGKGKPEKED